MNEQWRKGLLAAGWDLRRAVELAIGVEERATALYRDLAKRWESDAGLRDLFAQLAREEVEHREGFLTLLSSVGAHTNDNALDEACLKAIAEASFFSEESGALGEIANLASPGLVLDAVLKFERATLLYYQGLKDVIGANPTLDIMIAEEKRHTVEVTRAMEGSAIRDRT